MKGNRIMKTNPILRILSAMLILSILCSCGVAFLAFAEETLLLGDVNGDTYITNADVLAIFRYIYNPELYPVNVIAADVNHDSYVTNADVLAIFRYIYNSELYPIA